VPYDVWVRQGFIFATPGNVIDYGFILAQIQRDMSEFDLREIAFDRWGATKIVQDLQELGFDRTDEATARRRLVDFGQGFASMASPTRELEKLVAARQLAHGGHPVLSWMAGNAVVRQDPAGNMKIDKAKSTERVDGMVALVMALDRALRNGSKKSVYETRGVRTA
jgi:phage terminase large subunit-like protein